MSTTRVDSAAEALRPLSLTQIDDRSTVVWRELLKRLDEDGRTLLRELDAIDGERLVRAEERVLATAGRFCQQYGQPALFEVIYLEVQRDSNPRPGDGMRWLTSLTQA